MLSKLPSNAPNDEDPTTPPPPSRSDLQTPRTDGDVDRVLRNAEVSERSPRTAKRLVRLGCGVKRAAASLAKAQTELTLANKRPQELTDAAKEPRKAHRVDTTRGKLFTPDEIEKQLELDRGKERWEEARKERLEELKAAGKLGARRVNLAPGRLAMLFVRCHLIGYGKGPHWRRCGPRRAVLA